MIREFETSSTGAAFSEQIPRGLQVVFDFAAILIAGLGCWLVVLGVRDPELIQRYLFASLIAATLSISVLGYSRMYDFDVVTEPQSHLRGLVGSLVVTFLALLFLAFSLGHADAAFSRIWPIPSSCPASF